MKLNNLNEVTALATDRRTFVAALDKCGAAGVAGWGDWWWVEFQSSNGEPKNRLRVPAGLVCQFVTAQIAEIDDKLKALGVTP